MAYNNGNFSLFNQTGYTSSTQVFAEKIIPTFAPPSGSTYTNVYGSVIDPSVVSTGTSTVGTIYGVAISMAISAGASTVSNAFTLAVAAPTISSSTVTNVYALYASAPSVTASGTITGNYTAYIGGPTGIGTTTPKNFLDVYGSVAIGSYAGTTAAPPNSVILTGSLGIGTSSPAYPLDVQGAASAFRVTAGGTTVDNQLIDLAEGYNQGGFGGGSVGTQKTMSQNTTLYFDTTANLNASSVGFIGSVFDGRYLYLVPNGNSPLQGQVTRYDTTLSFSSSSSYAVFDMAANVNPNSLGFRGGLFDGRYIYYIPHTSNSGTSGQITRYDTTLPFANSASYAIFNTRAVNSNSLGFYGGVFDGRYLYLAPYANSSSSIPTTQITQYDTTLSFTSPSSYSFFNLATVQSNAGGYFGAVFDGRYVYYVPYIINVSTSYGQVARYDTTLSFSSSNSYAFFDTATLQSNSIGFGGGAFDGRYVYLAPFVNRATSVSLGQITRYDTTLPFSSSSSYAFFDTSTVQSNSKGFASAVYDGRYLYFVPYSDNGLTSNFGQVTRYDTTLPFSSPASYSFFNTTAGNANSMGFASGTYDGRYIYLSSFISGGVSYGMLTRLDAYPGQQATALNISQSPNGVAFGTYSGVNTPPTGGLIVSGKMGIGTATPAYTLDVQGAFSIQTVASAGTTRNNQNVQLFEGYNQGGFGGGSVGTNKTMSQNTTLYFDTTANVNSLSIGFRGSVFDGRYVYFVPFDNGARYLGQITRYDTTQSFSASSSYAIYAMAVYGNSNSLGFSGGVFDGRYIYYVPEYNGSLFTYVGQITRYDTTLPFGNSNSYAVFDTLANINSNSGGFRGGLFDGRYVYLVPNVTAAYSGQITRYDTTLPFGNSNSYAIFDTAANVNSLSLGFYGGVFDGRYIYLIPNFAVSTYLGQITRYDTTLSFSASTSYVVFDTAANVNSNSAGFNSGTFDGRYVYLAPYRNNSTYSGQITRYDTTQPFTAATSYAVFDGKANVNSLSAGFWSCFFDGRYLYLMTSSSTGGYYGQVTRYDTTQPFTAATSYSILNTAAGNSNSVGFVGGAFDGRYVYFSPSNTSTGEYGQITRIDAYPGPQANAINASQAPNGFVVGSYVGTATPTYGGLIVSGQIGIGTTTPGFTVDVQGAASAQAIATAGTTKNNQNVQLFEGYNQGGFGGGNVGTQKTMSQNTTQYFNTQAVNVYSTGFSGGVFDGRYVYCVPYQNTLTFSGQLTRYDTTQSFSSSTSYSFFDTGANVNSNSRGFSGGAFDGRYVYLGPFNSGQITRYDTTLSFGLSTSYAFFDTAANVNSNSRGFDGAIFDGRYVYFAPSNVPATNAGEMLRYDTTASFTSASSYALFSAAANVNSNCLTFVGGTYDGRYVYFAPSSGFSAYSGQILLYDTTLPFGISTSYSVFDTSAQVNSLSNGFASAIFDGRYVYLIPQTNVLTASGQITRYDTTLAFGSSSSYAIFDTVANVNSNSRGFIGGQFDGRYVYLVPYSLGFTLQGQITRYDTTLPFTSSSSYTVFNTASGNSISVGFIGSVFDGRYIYLLQRTNPNNTQGGLITRIDAYPGVRSTAINASWMLSGGAIGSYAGTVTPPTNGLIVSGNVGVGTGSPNYTLDIQGALNTQSVASAGTTKDNQLVQLFEGYNQGGFGGGSVGTNKTMSQNTTAYFDTMANVNSNSVGFNGAVFDGRYVYLVPYTYGIGFHGQITRYDTTLSFSVSTSYAVFDTKANVNSMSAGFVGGAFDGRYVYFVPSYNLLYFGQITRYDTTLPFGISTSYAVFDTQANVNSNSAGFKGALFDGRYVYYVPYYNGITYSGQITRYDTTLPFSASTSYAVFDTEAKVNSYCGGFNGGTFDGRYLYFAPTHNTLTYDGQITRYDTTLPFGTASSYAIFDTATYLNSNSAGFSTAVFDGRYVYFIPYNNGVYFGQITRYDTTLPFAATSSYAIFNTAAVNSLSQGFLGGVFDGRYLYLSPFENGSGVFSGQVTRYDTTLPFTSSASYSVFNTTLGNSKSTSFYGSAFDGRYVYLVPYISIGGQYDGQITRLDAYPGPQARAMSASFSPSGLQLGYSGITPPTGGLIVSTQVGVGTAAPAYTLDVAGAVSANQIKAVGTTENNQNVQLFEGYNQGGFGGGSVGTNKTMSQNTTAYFDTATINTNSVGFRGGAFDGRFLYLVPYQTIGAFFGQITRYDTSQPFGASASYVSLSLGTFINSNALGFQGAVYDGRYVYLVPFYTGTTYHGSVTRYDTTLSFSSSSSYAVFNMGANVNSKSVGFFGAVFDGRYIYFVPELLGVAPNSGQITQYDTTLPFGSASSYAYFDTTANVNSNSQGFAGGVFDGRYVYLVPFQNQNTFNYFGQITRYDTTLPFATAGSYSIFDTKLNVNSNSAGFVGGVFDGRYVYLVPNTSSSGNLSGQVTRYDTTLPFGTATSYTYFNTAILQSNSAGFVGGVFDGRYIYFVPYNNPVGQVTRFDTTQPFGSLSSYAVFLTSAGNSNSQVFWGALFDGRYIYLIPNNNFVGGQITRLDAYPGPQANAISASNAPNGFAIGAYAGSSAANGNLIVGGSVGINTPTPAYTIDIAGNMAAQQVNTTRTTENNQRISLAEGYNQGSFGGGSVGTNKTMSANTTQYFYLANISGFNGGQFIGSAFDGRFIYLAPAGATSFQTIVLRYDTTQTFGVTSSYAAYDTSQVNSLCGGYGCASFDGRYVYFCQQFGTNSTLAGLICRYDSTMSFSSSMSYAFFNTTSLQSNSVGFLSTVFDGRYIYLCSSQTGGFVANGQIARYDTTASFTAAASYSFFDTGLNINSFSVYFNGSTYDGRYVYFIPWNYSGNYPGQVTRYDTTLPFGTAASYAVSSAGNLNSNGVGYFGGVFDGRFVYYIPNRFGSPGGLTNCGVLTRYDTTLPFGLSTSYAVFDMSVINANCIGFYGGVFDGRYLYSIPSAGFNAYVTRYDTTLPFGLASSYSAYNVVLGNSNAIQFYGAIYDGRYLYLTPQFNYYTRLDAYAGPPATALSIGQSPGNFNVTGTLTIEGTAATTATAGTNGASPTVSQGFIIVNINGSPQKIPYFNI